MSLDVSLSAILCQVSQCQWIKLNSERFLLIQIRKAAGTFGEAQRVPGRGVGRAGAVLAEGRASGRGARAAGGAGRWARTGAAAGRGAARSPLGLGPLQVRALCHLLL